MLDGTANDSYQAYNNGGSQDNVVMPLRFITSLGLFWSREGRWADKSPGSMVVYAFHSFTYIL